MRTHARSAHGRSAKSRARHSLRIAASVLAIAAIAQLVMPDRAQAKDVAKASSRDVVESSVSDVGSGLIVKVFPVLVIV